MWVSHQRNLQKQESRFPNKKLWYLEVCCARPSMQGKGVGKCLMEWVVETVGDSACLLECTDKSNVEFYRRFGFETVDMVKLKDGDDVLNTWLMVRQ